MGLNCIPTERLIRFQSDLLAAFTFPMAGSLAALETQKQHHEDQVWIELPNGMLLIQCVVIDQMLGPC